MQENKTQKVVDTVPETDSEEEVIVVDDSTSGAVAPSPFPSTSTSEAIQEGAACSQGPSQANALLTQW